MPKVSVKFTEVRTIYTPSMMVLDGDVGMNLFL